MERASWSLLSIEQVNRDGSSSSCPSSRTRQYDHPAGPKGFRGPTIKPVPRGVQTRSSSTNMYQPSSRCRRLGEIVLGSSIRIFPLILTNAFGYELCIIFRKGSSDGLPIHQNEPLLTTKRLNLLSRHFHEPEVGFEPTTSVGIQFTKLVHSATMRPGQLLWKPIRVVLIHDSRRCHSNAHLQTVPHVKPVWDEF